MVHEGTRHYVAEREPTEGEAMASVPVVEVPDYADHELGCMVRMALEGAESGEIADAIGVTAREVARKLTHIRLVLSARHLSMAQKPHRATGRPAHRPRSVSDEIVAEMVKKWNGGATIRELARYSGLSESGVQWVLRPYRDEMA